MSRSSPGRYALHEFAKNVFDVQAFDGKGKELHADAARIRTSGTSPGTTARCAIVYKVFGDRVDGTYLGDRRDARAHEHAGDADVGARPRRAAGRASRSSRRRARTGSVATQLFPTDDPWTFTAPNLQYLMDSPTELSDSVAAHVHGAQPRRQGRSRSALRSITTATDARRRRVRRRRREDRPRARRRSSASSRSSTPAPTPSSATTCRGATATAWSTATARSSPRRCRCESAARSRDVLDTVSHEFFHCWNVERIRPKSLEPFNFEEANMSGELWLAEGFTQYYGTLDHGAAPGSRTRDDAVAGLATRRSRSINSPGRQFRSAVEMSQLAPFIDAARADRSRPTSTTRSSPTTPTARRSRWRSISSLRDRSNGKITLDDYMRAMWAAHGKPGGPQPGLVAKPYTLKDAARSARGSLRRSRVRRRVLRQVHRGPRRRRLRAPARAGRVRAAQAQPGRRVARRDEFDRRERQHHDLVPWGSPLFEAGLDQGDIVLDVDGKAIAGGVLQAALKARKPGDQLQLSYKRRGGATGTATVTLKEDPSVEVVTVESTGATLTAEQKAFRDSWLGPKAK